MLPFCRALFDMIYTACLGAIVSKRSSSRPPELNFFNSAKGLHHPTINIQFKSRPLQKQHEPFVSLDRVLLAALPGGMMLTRPNISSYITRGKGAWREIGVRVLFLGRAHTWWRCVRQMCTCPTRAPQDSCLASGSRVEQPLIRASAPSIQLSLVHALIGPFPPSPRHPVLASGICNCCSRKLTECHSLFEKLPLSCGGN